MSTREQSIVELLHNSDCIAPQALADKLGVSVRTLRSDVTRINNQLDPFATIALKRGKGYVLIVHNQDRLNQYMQQVGSNITPQTPQERIDYLVSDLLERNDWITLEELSANLFVSRYTVSDDLKAVEGYLAKYNLILEKKPHYGIRIAGTEFSRRICLAALAVNKIVSNTASSQSDISNIVDCVGTNVENILRQYAISLSDVSYRNLLVHIAIAVIRMREGHEVPVAEELIARVKDTSEYQAAAAIAQSVGEAFDLTFSKSEVAYITIHLMGKKDMYASEDSAELVISEEAWQLASEMISIVADEFGFDFSEDFELRMNLARHVVPLAVRLSYNMTMENPLLSDIKSKFQLAYAMAAEASLALQDRYNAVVSEAEIGYIALAFALALDRKRTGNLAMKNIIVVCASGAGSARLLEHRVRAFFESVINSLEVCSVQELEAKDLSNFDAVLTTVPLSRPINIPVVEISAFLDDSEVSTIHKVLTASEEKSSLSRFFDQRLFFPHLQVESKEQAIAFMCERMREIRGADDDIESLVFEREALALTSFGNSVAMPHPLRPVCDESTVCVAINDTPIDWGGGKFVQALFLICISRNKDQGLQPLYQALSHLMGSATEITSLIRHRSFDALMEQLKTTD